MSHSQFQSKIIYTYTCMAQSLRRAYDYWQDQPDSYLIHKTYTTLQTLHRTYSYSIRIPFNSTRRQFNFVLLPTSNNTKLICTSNNTN